MLVNIQNNSDVLCSSVQDFWTGFQNFFFIIFYNNFRAQQTIASEIHIHALLNDCGHKLEY